MIIEIVTKIVKPNMEYRILNF